jgi:predicted dithiol-disulfide oxidoreductase (DUF899 family)
MTSHKIASRDEWLAARRELLAAEKELTRQSDALARRRQALPWVRIEKAHSTYARGLDGLWGMYQWLDRAPKGRNENGPWWRRHDEYDRA